MIAGGCRASLWRACDPTKHPLRVWDRSSGSVCPFNLILILFLILFSYVSLTSFDVRRLPMRLRVRVPRIFVEVALVRQSV